MTRPELDSQSLTSESPSLEDRKIERSNFEAKVQYYVAQSLDGFIADANHSLDWLLQFDSAQGVKEDYEAFLQDVGALVMGAATYEFVLQHGAWPYPAHPTWVFAHRPRRVLPGADVQFVSGAVANSLGAIARSARGRNLWLVGGGQLVADFASLGWLDELHVCVVPVVLGAGSPLLPLRLGPKLELLSCTQLGAGLTMLRYRVPTVTA